MSEFNVDIYSSGFVGVAADSPTKKTATGEIRY